MQREVVQQLCDIRAISEPLLACASWSRDCCCKSSIAIRLRARKHGERSLTAKIFFFFNQESEHFVRTHPCPPVDFPFTSHWPGLCHPSSKAGWEIKYLELQVIDSIFLLTHRGFLILCAHLYISGPMYHIALGASGSMK